MHQIGQHLRQPSDLQKNSTQVATLSGEMRPPCGPEFGASRAALLLGCYRKSDVAEPEIFAAGASAILSKFPADVAAIVTDPRTGLAGQLKFVPTLAEIQDACEREQVRIAVEQRRETVLQESIEAEREMQARRRAKIDESDRRKEVVRRARECFATVPEGEELNRADLCDARKIDDPKWKSIVAAHWSKRAAENAERYRKEPCVLSDLARAASGFPPLKIEAAE
jgi:hypothetical protein